MYSDKIDTRVILTQLADTTSLGFHLCTSCKAYTYISNQSRLETIRDKGFQPSTLDEREEGSFSSTKQIREDPSI